MIIFKVNNIEISYQDNSLDEVLLFDLLKDHEVEIGSFDNPMDYMENHLTVDRMKLSSKSTTLMHKYIDNMIACDNAFNFISNNNLFEYFDFKTGLFTCEVIIK